MRIDYARERMKDTLSGDLVPSVQTYEVTREDGAWALLGCTFIFAGQDEDIEWHGAYASRGAFLSHLKAEGYFLASDGEELTDKELTGMWRRD